MAVRQYTVNATVDQKRLQLSAKTALASQTIKIPVDVEAKGISDLKVASTTMNKLKDSAGNTRVEIEKFNSSGQKLGTTIKNTSKEVTTLGQDFISTLGKVAKFGAVTAILSGFTASIGEAVSVVKDLDDAMVDYEKVSDLSGDALTEYVNKLSDLGDAVYRNKIEMTESATLMKQAGYSDDDSAKLAQMANLYMNIADNEESAADASSMLIGQMKSFNISADDSIQIIDGINEVDILAFLIEI